MPNLLEIRIKNIQDILGVAKTGVFDLKTCLSLEKLLNLEVQESCEMIDHKTSIQIMLGFKGRNVDGIFGPMTISRIENFLKIEMPPIPEGACMIVSKKSLEIIIESEISSKAWYTRKYKYPSLPGAESGITIGIGYDLGYASSVQFTEDWKDILPNEVFENLKTVLGLKKTEAKNALSTNIKNLEIPWNSALEVFYTKSMPKYAKRVAKAYPKVGSLPPDAQGALLSLVYNRGSSLTGSRRQEMANIVQHVASGDLIKIANEIRAMKRLWDATKLRGLHIRRDREADLVENASFHVLPEDYIFV